MWKDSDTDRDLLSFNYLVKTVEDICLDSSLTPSTVGIYGDWGSGKSSLMRMVAKDLSQIEGVKCITINGWLFEGYDDARSSLCGTILDDIAHDKKLAKNIKDKARKLLKKVDYKKILAKGGKIGLDFLLTGGIGTLSEIAIDNVLDIIKKKVGNISEDDIKKIADKLTEKESKRHEVKKFNEEFKDLLGKSNINHLIIFIDELDRCQPETILDIFEAMRLFLFVDGTTFVIGADERLIQYAIKTKYIDVPGNDLDIGKEYLEKMIQYPITIPQLNPLEVHQYITSLLVEDTVSPKDYESYLEIIGKVGNDKQISYDIIQNRDKELAERIKEALDLSVQISSVLAEILSGNPRQCKRFLNTLQMRCKMGEIRNAKLNRRVMAKLMLVEYFKPSLFRLFFNKANFPALKNLESGVEITDDSKVKEWETDEWVKKWAKSDPKLPDNFEELQSYLFFARDKFRYGRLQVKDLGARAQKCYDLITSKSQTNINKALEIANDCSPAEITNLVDALFEILKSSEQIDNDILKAILKLNSAHSLQDDSVKNLLTLPLNRFNAGLIPTIVTETKNASTYNELSTYLSKNNSLKNAITTFEDLSKNK